MLPTNPHTHVNQPPFSALSPELPAHFLLKKKRTQEEERRRRRRKWRERRRRRKKRRESKRGNPREADSIVKVGNSSPECAPNRLKRRKI